MLNFSVHLDVSSTFTMAKAWLLFQGMVWKGTVGTESCELCSTGKCPSVQTEFGNWWILWYPKTRFFFVLFWPNLEKLLCQALIFHGLYNFCIPWPLHLCKTTRETQNSLLLTLPCVLFFSRLLHPFKTSFSPTDIFHFILVFNPQSRSIPFFFNLHSSQSRS